MNPVLTFCGYYCGLLAAIGIFFFLLLLILIANNSHYLSHLLSLKGVPQDDTVKAMGLAMGVSI